MPAPVHAPLYRRPNPARYTSCMDSVRFGRALGFGARQAVKTLVSAVDAATADGPSGRRPSTRTAATPPRTSPSQPLRPGAQSTLKAAPAARPRKVTEGLSRGTRRFGKEVWNPFVRLSGVLWLEVTGVFFGIFALFALAAVWRLHGAWRATATNEAAHRSLLGAVLMLALFGYFCVSSFVRARRRERGR